MTIRSKICAIPGAYTRITEVLVRTFHTKIPAFQKKFPQKEHEKTNHESGCHREYHTFHDRILFFFFFHLSISLTFCVFRFYPFMSISSNTMGFLDIYCTFSANYCQYYFFDSKIFYVLNRFHPLFLLYIFLFSSIFFDSYILFMIVFYT